MTDRKTASTITDTELDQLYDQLDALRTVARGYCPTCGRGDAAPTVTDWEQQKQRADQVEDLLCIAHDTSNKSEAERAQAVQRAETAERDAGIYRKRLARLTDGYAEQFRHLEHAEATIARVRRLAEFTRDHVAPGRDDMSLAQHELACAVLAALDEPAAGPAATQTTGGPACQYCGADCSDGRSWDGGNLYACGPCAAARAAANMAAPQTTDRKEQPGA